MRSICSWAAVAATLTVLSGADAAAETHAPQQDQGLLTAEHEWLRSKFEGAFTWTLLNAQTDEAIATGKGECSMQFGGLFLECRQFSPSGETISIAIMGYDSNNRKFQRVHWSGGETTILYGEGVRDTSGALVIEGVQTPAEGASFKYRAVMQEQTQGRWTYSQYRLGDGAPVELIRAEIAY